SPVPCPSPFFFFFFFFLSLFVGVVLRSLPLTPMSVCAAHTICLSSSFLACSRAPRLRIPPRPTRTSPLTFVCGRGRGRGVTGRSEARAVTPLPSGTGFCGGEGRGPVGFEWRVLRPTGNSPSETNTWGR